MSARLWLAVPAAALSLSLGGADLSHYRGFALGSDIAAAAAEAGLKPADAIVVHSRPASIQQLEWQPRRAYSSDPRPEAVREGLLTFLDGRLVRMVVIYDRSSIQGMTAQDLTDAISATYGKATEPGTEIRFPSNYGDSAKVISRWENAEFSYDLVRTGDQASFALVMYSKQQDALAQAAIAEAIRLDAVEAPQRAADRETHRLETERLELEKARSANKPAFKP